MGRRNKNNLQGRSDISDSFMQGIILAPHSFKIQNKNSTPLGENLTGKYLEQLMVDGNRH
jgi:hypothetical protein